MHNLLLHTPPVRSGLRASSLLRIWDVAARNTHALCWASSVRARSAFHAFCRLRLHILRTDLMARARFARTYLPGMCVCVRSRVPVSPATFAQHRHLRARAGVLRLACVYLPTRADAIVGALAGLRDAARALSARAYHIVCAISSRPSLTFLLANWRVWKARTSRDAFTASITLQT